MIKKKKAEIDFGGEKRTFYFGIGFLSLFVENTDNTLANLEDNLLKNPFKVLPELMYYSLLFGYVKQDLTPPFTKYDIMDWIDEDGVGVSSKSVMEFRTALINSFNPDLPKDKVKKKDKVRPTIKK